MRNLRIAALAMAIACLSIMSVAAFTPRSPEMARSEPSTEGLPMAAWYVPAQHTPQYAPEEAAVYEFY